MLTGHLAFQDRLDQVTKVEAVKEAYLAYVAARFGRHRVTKTPSELALPGVHVDLVPWRMRPLMPDNYADVCVHDELVCILLEPECPREAFAEWLEQPRRLVLARIERLLLKPTLVPPAQVPGKRAFLSSLQYWAYEMNEPFAVMLVETGRARDFHARVLSALPAGALVFNFSGSIIAALIPQSDEWDGYDLAEACVKRLHKSCHGRKTRIVPCASIACWPAGAPTIPLLLDSLQEGLREAIILGTRRARPVTLFADDYDDRDPLQR